MKACKNKLKSNRGASMLLALALFLICTMVSSVIIAAAASGASRNTYRAEQQQAYLAINSATDLLVESMTDMGSFVGVCVDRHYGCEECTIPATIEFFYKDVKGYRLDMSLIPNVLDEAHLVILEGKHPDTGKKWAVDESTNLTGLLGNLMTRAAAHVHQKGTTYTEQFELNLQNTTGQKETRMPTVYCDFTMSSNYSTSIRVSTAGSAYSIYIRNKAQKVIPDPVVNTDFGCSHTVYYKEYTQTGAFEDRKVDEWKIAGKETTTITRVSWDTPKVEKGVENQ